MNDKHWIINASHVFTFIPVLIFHIGFKLHFLFNKNYAIPKSHRLKKYPKFWYFVVIETQRPRSLALELFWARPTLRRDQNILECLYPSWPSNSLDSFMEMKGISLWRAMSVLFSDQNYCQSPEVFGCLSPSELDLVYKWITQTHLWGLGWLNLHLCVRFIII